MSLSVTTAYEDIAQRLNFPGISVYMTEVPEDVLKSMVNGKWAPYIVLTFAGPDRVLADRSLTGLGRHDSYRNLLTVEACAMTDAVASRVKDKVVDALIGFRPTDCDVLVLRGGGNYARSATTVRPATYVHTVGFTFLSNMTWSD